MYREQYGEYAYWSKGLKEYCWASTVFFPSLANFSKTYTTILLKALKENLRQRYPGQVFDYSCQYGGIDESTGRSKVVIAVSVAFIYLKYLSV